MSIYIGVKIIRIIKVIFIKILSRLNINEFNSTPQGLAETCHCYLQ